jgi:hypothetical protein
MCGPVRIYWTGSKYSNTMQYKGKDSASGIGRKLSINRPGATTVVGRVNDHERADESSVQGKYNVVPGQRELPNQWLRTCYRIQHSNRPDLQKQTEHEQFRGTHH